MPFILSLNKSYVVHNSYVLVNGGEITLPIWLFDVLVSPIVFLFMDIEFLIIFCLYYFSAEIVTIENDFTIIIGILHLLYSIFLTLSINTHYLV